MKVHMLLLVASVTAAASAMAVALTKDVTTADVCAVVPGAEVAKALGGALTEALLVRPGGDHARCRYTVETEAGEPAVVIVWLHAADDYDALHPLVEGPTSPAAGLGDAAFVTVDPDTARHRAFVLVRDVATLEVTGPTAAGVLAVASAAVRHLRP